MALDILDLDTNQTFIMLNFATIKNNYNYAKQ